MAAGPKTRDQRSDEFVRELTNVQAGLLRYITGLLGNRDAATTVLQETNLVLWRKSDEFCAGTNFEAWATRTAYWQVMAYIRDRGRDRHVFSEELIEGLSKEESAHTDTEALGAALRHCLLKLRDFDRRVLSMRYDSSYSIQEISDRLDRSQSAVKGMLMRTRRALRACIERRMALED